MSNREKIEKDNEIEIFEKAAMKFDRIKKVSKNKKIKSK